MWRCPLPIVPQALLVSEQNEITTAGYPTSPEAFGPIVVIRYAPSGDVNGDGTVNDADLLAVLFEYGTQGDTVADLNGNGVVEDSDLLTVLFEFGSSG